MTPSVVLSNCYSSGVGFLLYECNFVLLDMLVLVAIALFAILKGCNMFRLCLDEYFSLFCIWHYCNFHSKS